MKQIVVRRSTWKSFTTVPKGGNERVVPLTKRLEEALRSHRHPKDHHVLYQDSGYPLTMKVVQKYVSASCRKAGLAKGNVHMLRHTFCSHLAMRGASAMQINELAGHANLATTMRYMHLSPASKAAGINLLDQPIPDFAHPSAWQQFGNAGGQIS
jgi:site-specific recombinase XerD